MPLFKKQLPPIDPRIFMLFGLMDSRIKELRLELKKTKKELLDAMVLLSK